LIPIDIDMSGLSGWEVARVIKARRGNDRPLLIGVSGEYKQGSDRILSSILGFNHYLLKPYQFSELLRLMAPLRYPDADIEGLQRGGS
jgi:DNA-binding response OmpR family regulator